MNYSLLLHPNYFSVVIYIILPIVAIAQWIMIIPLAKKKNAWESLNNTSAHSLISKETHKIPFTKDGFFILWNIFPIFLLATYIFLGINWNDWSGDLLRLNNKEVESIYLKINSFRFHWATLLVITLISLYSALIQEKKQATFINLMSYMYWWDKRISKRIFYIRMAALFTNMFAVIFIIMTTISLSFFIIKVIHIDRMNLIFFHPDNLGGLGVIGDLTIILSSIYIFTSGLGLAAIFDHKFKQGWSHTISDIISLLFIVPALYVLIVPAINCQQRICTSFHNIIEATENQLRVQIPDEIQLLGSISESAGREELVGKWIVANAPKYTLLRNTMQIRSFPLDLSKLASLISTWLAPLFIFIFFNVYAKKKEEKNQCPKSCPMYIKAIKK